MNATPLRRRPAPSSAAAGAFTGESRSASSRRATAARRTGTLRDAKELLQQLPSGRLKEKRLAAARKTARPEGERPSQVEVANEQPTNSGTSANNDDDERPKMFTAANRVALCDELMRKLLKDRANMFYRSSGESSAAENENRCPADTEDRSHKTTQQVARSRLRLRLEVEAVLAE